MVTDTIFSINHTDDIPVVHIYEYYTKLSNEGKRKIIISLNNWIKAQQVDTTYTNNIDNPNQLTLELSNDEYTISK